MIESAVYAEALTRLRAALAALKTDEGGGLSRIEAERNEVRARYGTMFSPAGAGKADKQEFQSFLYLENNHHWSGLYRRGSAAAADIKALRQCLATLVDESVPLDKRIGRALDKVDGMGKALFSAILLVAYPDKYGVWNNKSEGALRDLGLWPEFDRGATYGQKYNKVNQVLLRLAADLGLDLWMLDSLWDNLGEGALNPPGPLGPEPPGQLFGLERHLHEFLRDNWEKTMLSKNWELLIDDEGELNGYEYRTDVGKIDLIAKHRTKPEWLVIELKRDQTSDVTMGQLLRYVGWVKQKLARPGDAVKGLVIAHEEDERLRFALSAVTNAELMLYEVDFRLKPPTNGPQG